MEKTSSNLKQIQQNGIFPKTSEQDKIIRDTRQKHQLPIGILNAGNTCFSNSVLQVMYHHSAFSTQICKFRLNKNKWNEYKTKAKNSSGKSVEDYKFSKNGCRFIQNLQTLFRKMANRSKRDPPDSKTLLSRMIWPNGKKMFEQGKQQDAVEFATCAFELIEAGFELDQQVGS